MYKHDLTPLLTFIEREYNFALSLLIISVILTAYSISTDNMLTNSIAIGISIAGWIGLVNNNQYRQQHRYRLGIELHRRFMQKILNLSDYKLNALK